MRKQIAAFLIPGAILGVLLHEVANTPFYTEAELRRVAEAAVTVARDGNTAEALKRFEALVDVAPGSPAVWADYLVVLPWAGERARAIELANRLPFAVNDLPAYTQRSLFESALRENRLAMAQRFAQSYIDKSTDLKAALIDSVDLLLGQSQPALALALISRYEKNLPDYQALLLRRVAAQLQLDNPLSLAQLPELIRYAAGKPEDRRILSRSLVNASRFRTDKQYLSALQQFYREDQSAEFAADYLTVLVWHGDFVSAVQLYQQWREQLPLYARKAAMQALAETGRGVEAEQLYLAINRQMPLSNEERRQFVQALIANGAAETAYALLENETGDDVRELRWQSLAKQGRDEELFAAMSEQLQRQADADLSLRWYDVYARLVKAGKFQDSDALLPAITSASVRVQEQIIRELIVRNQLDAARRLAQACQREPSFWLMISQAAGEARQQRNYYRALDLYRYGINSPETAIDSELGVVLSLREQGRALDAIAVMDSMLQRYPGNRLVADTAVDLYRNAGDNRRLLPLLEQTWLATGNDDYLRSWIGVVQSGNPYASLTEQRAAIAGLQQRHSRNDYLRARLALATVAGDQCIKQIDFSLQKLTATELEQLAFALRRCGDLPEAEQLYRYGQSRFVRNPVFPAGLMLTDIAQNNFAAAKNSFDGLNPAMRDSLEVQLAYAWWLSQQQRYREAANTYQQLARQYPANREAYVGQVMNANKAGEVERAVTLAGLREDWFSAEELARLQADRIAAVLRQAMEKSSTERNSLLMRALNQIASYQTFLTTHLPDDREKLLALRWDKQLALHLSGEHQAVLDDYAQSAVAVDETPVYALLTLADSQAALNRFAAAEQTLNTVLQREPANPRGLKAMYYVHLSQDNYPAAQQILATMKALAPQPVDENSGLVHWVWRQQAMFEAYRNRLGDAETLLKQLQMLAPDDAGVRQDLALIKRWRGQPESALALYEQNILKQQNTLDSRIGRAHALLEDRQHRAAGEQVALLAAEYETHPQVKELQRRWDVHNLREFDSRFSVGRSDGGVNGSSDFNWESWLYSAPENFADAETDYRWFAHHYYGTANFEAPERDAELHRIGAGVSVNQAALQLQWDLEVSQAATSESDKGLSLRGTWRPDDHWYLGANAQSYSLDVPVRATNLGLSGESLAISTGYRWHESSRIDVTAGVVNIEGGTPTTSSGVEFEQDDNQRRYLSAAFRQRIYADEIHVLDIIPQYYTSQNSTQDVRYFAPDKDQAVSISADYEGLLWREGLWRFKHHINVGIGDYQQWNFRNADTPQNLQDGGDLIWDWQYEHLWWWSDTLRFNYGLLHRKRSYDGDMEDQEAIFGGINVRF